MDLLERDHCFHLLSELLCAATADSGRTVLVSGEAGIGKTALLEHFVSQQGNTVRTLWGACEALFTPRPLGPLYDIAAQVRGRLSQLLEHDTGRGALFSAFLEELQKHPAPTIVVFEDVHWADEATLDLIKFLGRRVLHLPVLFLVTYRDTDLGLDHPLQSVLGDLPGNAVVRLRLAPLSEQAVTCLANLAHRQAEGLYAATLGNPFFVTEVLASDTEGVPMTVRDAVVARITRLSAQARTLLELASVVPTRTERWLLEEILSSTAQAAEECFTSGMLDLSHTTVAFRHELARQAIESTLSPIRKQALHAQVLQRLLSHEADASQAARLVHHAAGAHDETLVLRYAPLAARHAAAQGAHRQAAEHYRHALRYVDLLDTPDPEQHAELLDGLANECSLTGQIQEAFRAHAAALALWRHLDRTAQVGYTLHRLAGHTWHLGQGAEAYRYTVEAVVLLETLPPSRELGQAYANLSSQHMVSSNTAQALVWGRRAIEVAQQFHDTRTECYALFSIGSTTFCSGDEEGQAILEQSLHLAQKQGFEEIAALAYTNLANARIRSRAYAQATSYLQEGIAHCMQHDLDTLGYALRGERARARLDQGDWAGAEEDAAAILNGVGPTAINRIPALLILGLLHMRRGAPGAQKLLDEARDLAATSGEMQNITPVAAARAEWCWLQGLQEQCASEAMEGFQLALPCQRPWYLGEVAIWLWREGKMPGLPEGAIATPFALQIAGDWRGAAELWKQLGCPYEQALALADGDAEAMREALALFEQLGAQPAAAIMRRRLRQQGITGIPRGARPSTRANQAGLTNRQLEVLQLMAEGLSNAEIASRLFTSLKTVEHHVSAVLIKLGVHSRAQAIRAAFQMALLPNMGNQTSNIGNSSDAESIKSGVSSP
jgi:DNA-binding CsgD family transcriptional regulator